MAPLLAIDNLTKTFGGVHAIDALSFAINEARIHAVIGPNGAGKTTLLNLITGIYQPSGGTIRLDGQDIAGAPPHRLAALSMSRTFQNLQVCMNMTAMENVIVGSHLRMEPRFLPALLRLPGVVRRERRFRERAAELMAFVGIEHYRDAHANAMPYGALKRLEIARALAAEPRLLLLDEPAAGLNANETEEIDALIQKVADSGVTVVLVEHDMKLVMNISHHILVLDYGRKLAEGIPEAVRHNPDVIKAYLGAA